MDLINPLLQKYAEDLSSPVDSVLQNIEDDTYQHHADPHMLSGHLQGKVLEMISRMIGPRRILEIGTFTGYSALCLAKGLSSDGILHTIELREEDAFIARDYFNKAGLDEKIIVHTGNAL
ncbi:MAG: methyltransferase, partial [Chitinophagaceae bacterium]|nr:methyltransferase [Chitinophagaceae bacterium]